MRSIMKYFHYTNHQTHLETDHCVPPALSFIGKNLIVSNLKLGSNGILHPSVSIWIEEDVCLDFVIIQFYWYQTKARLSESSPYIHHKI